MSVTPPLEATKTGVVRGAYWLSILKGCVRWRFIFGLLRDCPVVIAANRDEFLERPAGDPTTLLENPHVVGGKDLKAGGTWLGISEHGIVAGLLNRRAENGANPDARSRGLLCLDALRRRTAREAAEFASRERGSDYNPFNLLMVSRDRSVRRLQPRRVDRSRRDQAGTASAVESRCERFRMSEDQRVVREVCGAWASARIFSAIRSVSARRWARCWRIIIRSLIRDQDGRMRCACISRIMGRGRRA